MKKKGIMIGETVEIILAILIVIGLLFVAVKLYSWFIISSLDETSLQHFNDLTDNIKNLKEGELLNNQVIFLEDNHEFVSFNKDDSEIKPESCYMQSCLCLCLGEELKDCGKENAKCIVGFDIDIFKGENGRVKLEGYKIFYLSVLNGKDKIIISETGITKNKVNTPNIYNFYVDPKPDDKILLANLEKLESFINLASETFGVDSSLIKAVIAQESDASIDLLKKLGKVGTNCKTYCGLMQVGETAFKDAKKVYPKLLPYKTFDDVKTEGNKEAQILVGTAYLKLKLIESKNEELALAAYNAGYGRVKSCENYDSIVDCEDLPAETKIYVPSVLTYKNYFESIS